MGLSGYHTEIVDGNARVDGFYQCRHLLMKRRNGGVAHHHRVHMDHRLTAQLLGQLLLNIVDHIMQLQYLPVRGHLRME